MEKSRLLMVLIFCTRKVAGDVAMNQAISPARDRPWRDPKEDEEQDKMKGSETNPPCTHSEKKHEHLAAVFRCGLFLSNLGYSPRPCYRFLDGFWKL